MNQANDDQLSGIPTETAKQMLEQGRLYLQAQLEAGVAADQRATSIATFFGSVAGLLFTVAIAYWQYAKDLQIVTFCAVAATLMVVGALICLWSARPVNFFFPGNHPDNWLSVAKTKFSNILVGEALNYQSHIEANDRILVTNSNWMKYGATICVAAPLVTFILFLLFLLFTGRPLR